MPDDRRRNADLDAFLLTFALVHRLSESRGSLLLFILVKHFSPLEFVKLFAISKLLKEGNVFLFDFY